MSRLLVKFILENMMPDTDGGDMRELLDEIINRNHLAQHSIGSFWEAYDAYLKEEPDECKEYGLSDRDSVSTKLSGYAFRVTSCNANCSDGMEESINIFVDFFRKDTGEYIGRYTCIFNLDGECVDDIFWS